MDIWSGHITLFIQVLCWFKQAVFSEITTKFTLGRAKGAYLMKYGIAPYFKSIPLISEFFFL